MIGGYPAEMFTTPVPPAPTSRPAPLNIGIIAAGIACLAAIVEGYFWIEVYGDLVDLIPADVAADPEFDQSLGLYKSFLVVIVVFSGLVAIATMAGGVLAMTGKNGGRILIWSAGGVAVAWHLCCSGYTLLIRAVFAQAVNSANAESTSGNEFHPEKYFPIWKVDAAVIAGFVAAIVVVIAIIAVAQGSVNRYFRALRPLPAPSGYQVPPGPYGPQW